MKKIATTLTLSLCVFLNGLSQNNSQGTTIRKCGTPILSEEYEVWVEKAIQKQNQFANSKKVSAVYTIPVVFHIIHSGQSVGTSYNISMAQVNSQINILNQDFRKTNADFATTVTQSAFVNSAADCEINFCAARISPTGAIMSEPGIDRILASSKSWSNPPYSDTYMESTVKPGSSWDPTKYMNIWIIGFSDNMTLGYAQFPTVPSGTNPITDIVGWGGAANTDGVVFDYRYVGNVGSATYPFNKGRTATHEVGHWLGLRHINGDSNCGSDYCSDTPAQGSLTSGCPSTTGGTSSSGCAASPNPPGKMYQNYMDYSDDRCMTMFTANQKARMQACMANCARRTSLATSTVCSVTGIEESTSELSIEVFPNPSSGDLYVSVSVLNPQDYSISVVNTLGQCVKEMRLIQSNGGTHKIDLSDKPMGIYFVTIKSRTVSKTKRIIIQ